MIMIHYRAVIVISALIISLLIGWSCKDESTTEPAGNKPVIVSFTANPPTVPVGGDSVKLSWNVSGATSLSISPGVGTVTPADSGSITVFVSSATTFKLTAINSDGNVTANAPVNVAQPITVNGYVKDIDGEPVSGVTVMIKGKTPTTTDGNGGFSFSNVSTPYEVRVIISIGQVALVYQGLTRSDPTLLYLGSTTLLKSATISGVVPPAAGKISTVFFVSGNMAWTATANQSTGAYSIVADWKGSTNSFSGTLQVLRWTQNTSGMPEQYDAYGSKDNLTISDGGTFNNQNFTASDLTDPAELNISGSIVRPSSNYELYSKTLYLTYESGTIYAKIYLGSENGASLTDNFSYVVPSLTGATFGVDAWGVYYGSTTPRNTVYWKRAITGGSSGITINLSSSPQLNLPAHNGAGIDTTTQFLWTKGNGGGICYVLIEPSTPGAGPTFYLMTGGNTTSIPNLAPQGLGLPSNVSYTWSVTQFFPVASVDEAASSTFLQQALGQTEGGEAMSEDFNFTTKL
jgi:hypothetical protein